MAELGALVVLVVLAYALFTVIPQLATLANDLYLLYRGELERLLRRGPEKTGT